MSDAWQLTESFERTRQLLVAVNKLSIHTKLLLAGREDRNREEEAREARRVIRAFLDRLARDLPTLENDSTAPITGAPERAMALARRFSLARSQAPASSPLFSLPPNKFAVLLDSQEQDERRMMVEGLATLRNLLEQHHHADSVGMLGDL